MDIQESESAIIISFIPYYPGCVPVQIVNHFPDIAIKFMQESKYTVEPLYQDTSEFRIPLLLTNITVVYILNSPEMSAPHYSGHFNLVQ